VTTLLWQADVVVADSHHKFVTPARSKSTAIPELCVMVVVVMVLFILLLRVSSVSCVHTCCDARTLCILQVATARYRQCRPHRQAISPGQPSVCA